MRVSSHPSSSLSRAASRLVFRVLCWWLCATTHFLPMVEEEGGRTSSALLVSANNSPVGSGTGTQPTVENSNSTNNGTSSWTLKSDRPASEVVRDIVIIFFAGVAIIGSLVCATYVITVLFDRFRGWFGLPPLEDDDHRASFGPDGRRVVPVVFSSQPVHVGRLVHEAGLHGISKEQRMLLVQHLLPPTPYEGNSIGISSTSTSSANEDVRDVERAEVVVGDVDSGLIHRAAADLVPQPDADDIDYEHTCSICLAPYGIGEHLLRSNRCAHVFHWDCCQEWLQKRDVCPYCRTLMFTADDLRMAAADVLGPAPLEQPSRVPSNPSLQEPAAAPADPTGETGPALEPMPAGRGFDEGAEMPQGLPSSQPVGAAPESRDAPRVVDSGTV